MNTKIKRENGKVWLESVQGWFVGDKESSVHAAQEAAMQAAGEAIDYHTLLGVSGLAFRMQVSKEGLCPSSPHSCCGYRCIQRSAQALPWEIDLYKVSPEDTEGTARARKAVVDSIERGMPVQYGREEDGLIVGYQNDGQEWLVLHRFKEGGKVMVTETEWPWGMLIFTRPKETHADLFSLALEALRQAIEMAHSPESGGYYLGFHAWEAYIAKLTDLLDADPENRQGSMHGNAWIYECLIQYRRSAAVYLRQVAADFPGPGASHLHKAASLYEQMANRILCDQENCLTAIAPFPWMLKEGETWTRNQIEDQVSRLKEAYALEREAITDLEQALALLEKEEPVVS